MDVNMGIKMGRGELNCVQYQSDHSVYGRGGGGGNGRHTGLFFFYFF